MKWLDKKEGAKQTSSSGDYHCTKLAGKSGRLVHAFRISPFVSFNYFGSFAEAKAACERDAESRA